MKNRLLWLAILLCLTSIRSSATIVYVDSANFAGNQDGTSWASAYYSFQYGIDFSNPGDTIWVAKGTYLPVAGTFFTLKKDIKIFGGFTNTDTIFSQRNFIANETRLKGNGHSVIRNDSTLLITSSTILDGFTISNGTTINGGIGGGMYNRYASPTVTNCIFINNTTSPYTSGGGGAMANIGGAPYIAYCTFSSNSAPIFYGNPPNSSGWGGGGAMTNIGSSPVFYRCTFSSNSAAGYGGAMYNTNAHLTISYCRFSSNTANSPSISERGGAMYNGFGTTLNLDSCVFNSNNGGSFGGAIYNDSIQSSNVKRCEFWYNTAAEGAGIYSIKNTIDTFDLCSFNNNTAYGSGGGLHIYRGKLVITNSTFSRNKSSDYDGGSLCLTSNSMVTASNCNFSGNYCNVDDGSVYLESAVALRSTFSNCSFTSDSAGYAGVLHATNAPVTLSNCSFNQCKSEWGAGAVMLTGSLGLLTSYITDCSFTGNKSVSSTGGALQIRDISPAVTNCSFTSNQVRTTLSGGKGGAIHIFYSSTPTIDPTISNCTFTNNSAYTGAGIYSQATAATITGCNFIGNTATYQGGGFSGDAARIKNCTFTGNNARYGGGIYPNGFPIERCLFSANTARRGGGINSNSSLTSVVNCIFTKNVVDSFGGGMYNSAPPAFVTNSTFVGNKANVLGSPIYNTNFGDYNDSTFTNCIIWGNYSGIYNQNTGASAFSYSLVQGLGTFAVKHIIGGTVNPQFVDTSVGNYQLLGTSPCIDQGYNSYVPAGIITDFVNGTRILNNIVDFGALEFGNIPLGINLLHFAGKKQDNNAVLLEWQMNCSKAVSTTLQRSSDGRNFSALHNVHTPEGLNNQFYLDEQPLSENYYRLKTTDEQGVLNYSNTILIRLNTKAAPVTIFPNPTRNLITIQSNGTAVEATVLAANGQLVKRQNLNTSSTAQMDISGLAQGVYLLQITHTDGTRNTMKLVKE